MPFVPIWLNMASAQGITNVAALGALIEQAGCDLDLMVVETARLYLDQIEVLSARIATLEKVLKHETTRSQSTVRLMTMPELVRLPQWRSMLCAVHDSVQAGTRLCRLWGWSAPAFKWWKTFWAEHRRWGSAIFADCDHRCDGRYPLGGRKVPGKFLVGADELIGD